MTLQDLIASIANHEKRSTNHDDLRVGGNGNAAREEQENSSSTTEQGKPKNDLEKIVAHLQNHGWKNFSVHPDRGVIVTNAALSNGSYQIVIHLKQDEQILIVYVYCPSKAPTTERLEVSEFITRANYGIMIGNFEMDFTDGEIRYKGAIEYKGGCLVDEMIEQLLGKCVCIMDKYFPGLMRVIYGNVSAQTAIGGIEPAQSRGQAAAMAVAQLLGALADESSTVNDAVEMPAIDVSMSAESVDSNQEDTPPIVATPVSPSSPPPEEE